ncbi:lipoprotein, partial [Hyphomonas adhaerens MHS-3]
MSFKNKFKSAMARSVAVAAIVLAAACSQGSSISSPGATDAGTPPGGSTGGSSGGSGSGATCPSGFTEGTPVGGLTTCDLSGAYLTNITLENIDGIAYRLSGRVDIGTDVGAEGNIAGSQPAVLTIKPGVTVFGESGSDYLVINRGSQIVADGTAAQPIIFTSADDLERQADSDSSNDLGGDANSEWGGLVLLGQAPINRCKDKVTPATAQCENIVEGVTTPEAVYGGADTTDNSGVLDYVQVRFAGYAINTAGNELNGITFAGIGSGTRVENIQVHNNSDDGVEFFGGTVNISHLVLTGNADDSIDTDNGYAGHIQYVVVVQNENFGDNITEASSVSSDVAPQSNPIISNFTFVGNQTNAFRFNTGTLGHYLNGVV